MPTYKIRGIDVDFPFVAYDSQLVYMDKVLQSLQEKRNALLESPTGTGKTLCLLCATLAWRKSLGSFTTGVSYTTGSGTDKSDAGWNVTPPPSQFPTIVYASRTHSQIRQVVRELKRTSYRPKMVVLGSREQLCIHDQVKSLQGKSQTNACRFLCRRGKKDEEDEDDYEHVPVTNLENHKQRPTRNRCKHFGRVHGYLKKDPHIGEQPVDIEDLVNIGTSHGPCPYYLSKELHKVVDIVFAPYNYLIDRGYRKSLHFSWKKSILIFDEAHNLESICADAASFDLTSSLLTTCISDAHRCIGLAKGRRDKSTDKPRNPDDFAILKALLKKLEKRIAEVPIESKELGYTKPGPYIYALLADLNIRHETACKLTNILEAASTLVEEDNQENSTGNICRLDSIREILDLVFRDGETTHAKYYRVHVREVEARAANGSKGKVSRTLSWWCFNPGIAMEVFPKLGVGSIILTSGTLSPMESFAQELKLDFPIQLENPHVITANQIWAGVVPAGPSGHTFNSSYRTRDSLEYKQDLGNAIVNLARIVPDGLLVFFPSYYLMDLCIGCWKSLSNESSMSIWERICKHKRPVIEPRESALFASSIKDYTTTLNDTSASGAVFFAVCRGKVSEGLDFADHAGRAVVITGLPFATSTDPKVRLKREFLDQQSRAVGELFKKQVLTGDEWYSQQASRAVNQAVGRVIRHRHDYGAIIFCDERFTYPNRLSQVSRWIQPHIKCYSRFGEVVFTLTRFFRDGRTRGPMKQSLLEADNGGNQGEMPSSEHHVDKFYMDKLLSPLTTPVPQNCSLKASSLSDTKISCSSFMGKVVPANRSSLSSDNAKVVDYENSRDICGTFFHERKTVVSQERCRADSCQQSENPKDMSLAPCFTKKRKFIAGEYDLKPHVGNYEHPSSGSQTSQGGVDLQCKGDGTSQSTIESGRQKGNLPADFASSAGDETQGSQGLAFLTQVRDKLSSAEYKDFVGYMKALKTKAMKIAEVLQCISSLFSGPERLPLLIRFKDYVPAKYHSLYEQYVGERE